MTNIGAPWRTQGPKGMNVVVYSRPCGWHIILQSTGPTIESRLKPSVLAKACVPYVKDGAELVVQDQVGAILTGIHAIYMGDEQTCHNL